MVFNDAASYCLPSIAKNIGGVRSLIKNNSGILMPKNTNTEEIAEKISNSLIVDNTKIKKETDWDPKTNIMDELKYMIEKKED